jgi:hypothetical protein
LIEQLRDSDGIAVLARAIDLLALGLSGQNSVLF